MDRQISAFDAKTHLSQLLREAEQGRTITITRHGKAVARLMPVRQEPGLETAQLAASFRAIRQAAGGRLRLKELIREGRKY